MAVTVAVLAIAGIGLTAAGAALTLDYPRMPGTGYRRVVGIAVGVIGICCLAAAAAVATGLLEVDIGPREEHG